MFRFIGSSFFVQVHNCLIPTFITKLRSFNLIAFVTMLKVRAVEIGALRSLSHDPCPREGAAPREKTGDSVTLGHERAS
jgi:hypothetical protein